MKTVLLFFITVTLLTMVSGMVHLLKELRSNNELQNLLFQEVCKQLDYLKAIGNIKEIDEDFPTMDLADARVKELEKKYKIVYYCIAPVADNTWNLELDYKEK